jgi:hypothetical protein
MECWGSLHCSQKPVLINIKPKKADQLTAKLLLVLASTVIFGSECHGTHDHTLLSEDFGSLQTTFF